MALNFISAFGICISTAEIHISAAEMCILAAEMKFILYLRLSLSLGETALIVRRDCLGKGL